MDNEDEQGCEMAAYKRSTLFPARGRTWHLPLLKFMRFLSAHFYRLLRTLWIAAQPPKVSEKHDLVPLEITSIWEGV